MLKKFDNVTIMFLQVKDRKACFTLKIPKESVESVSAGCMIMGQRFKSNDSIRDQKCDYILYGIQADWTKDVLVTNKICKCFGTLILNELS